MIIEQAFYQLPEILVGSGYPSQDYESGIVAALSMSLLQQLNGRNIQNPLSLIQMEKPFRENRAYWKDADGKKRYLRADLHFNSYPIAAGNPRLSKYGWRHSNWIEAKFFRSTDSKGNPCKSSNQAVNTADLLADLLRIMILVRRQVSKKDGKVFSGRYLLHVYLRQLSDHLCLQRNVPTDRQTNNGEKRETRPWLAAITNPGRQPRTSLRLGDETETIKKGLNKNLNDVTIEFSSENFVITPATEDSVTPNYVCHLTRIDEFTVTYGADHWGVGPDRKEIESSAGAFTRIRDHVGSHIKTKGVTEAVEPTIDESNDDMEESETNGEAQPAP